MREVYQNRVRWCTSENVIPYKYTLFVMLRTSMFTIVTTTAGIYKVPGIRQQNGQNQCTRMYCLRKHYMSYYYFLGLLLYYGILIVVSRDDQGCGSGDLNTYVMLMSPFSWPSLSHSHE